MMLSSLQSRLLVIILFFSFIGGVYASETVDDSLLLNQGWNFISFPYQLDPSCNTGALFAGIDSARHSVFTYRTPDTTWIKITNSTILEPCIGYWVYANSTTRLQFKYQDPKTTPRKTLFYGWNTFGPCEINQKSTRDTLLSIRDKWTQVMSFDSKAQRYDIAIINGGSGAFNDTRNMVSKSGYWLYMQRDGVYLPEYIPPTTTVPTTKPTTTAPTPTPIPTPGPFTGFNGEIEEYIYEYTNQERIRNGKSTLVYDAALSSVARYHSEDMARNNYFSHYNQLGKDPTERANAAGYNPYHGKWYGIGENLCKVPIGELYFLCPQVLHNIQDDPESIASAMMDMWVNHDSCQGNGHRDNILSGDYARIGIGVAYDGEEYIVTQDFCWKELDW